MRTRTIVAGALMASLLFSGAAFAQDPAPTFTDVKFTHQYNTAVEYLHTEQVIEGYADGTYKPEQQINRAEFLKIVLETAGVEETGENCYTDVKSDWFAPYVCKATELGFVEGYPNGNFHPERNINFAEASKIVANVLELQKDDQESDPWYKRYVMALETKNAIPAEISAFEHAITRGEMAEMVWRIDADVTTELTNTYANIEDGFVASAVAETLVAFASCTELKDHLVEASASSKNTILEFEEAADADDGSAGSVAPSAATADSTQSSSNDFSETNVQVEGVDEADIVKNDGEYIYVLKGSTIRIVKAYQPQNLFETAIIEFDDSGFSPNDMYVDGNKLIILGTSYEAIAEEEKAASSILPYYPPATTLTKVYIYDITDKTNPSLDREVKLEGDLNSSRKIDDMVYVISNKYDHGYHILEDEAPESANLLPLITDTTATETTKPISGCDQVLYHPGSDIDDYVIVTGIPVNDTSAETVSKVTLGNSDKVYASRENLYVAEGSYHFWYPTNADNHTLVHKFSLNPAQIDYEGKAKVPGDVLNQFSMDEHNGYFRIATTKGNVWDEENLSSNNLYIFDQDLTKVGEIEGIARGEQIYSVRFVGDRAYMVTFKKVDPLFVIDVSSPTSPQILGQLKIPGFSDYLHPVDENHIIGFGLDTVEASDFEKEEWDQNFAWYQGVKIAMFDVTDVTAPTELHREIIGDRGTETPLRYNHKALLYAEGKGQDGKTLMSLPVRLAEIDEETKNDPATSANTYGDYVGQYAYIYDVSVEDGFEFRDRITHYDGSQTTEDFYRADKNINRILYIGEYLYTVSRALVRANNLDTLEYNNEVELEDRGDDYFYYWY